MQYLESSCVRGIFIGKGSDIGRRATVVKGADRTISKARVQLLLCRTQQGKGRVCLLLGTNIDDNKEDAPQRNENPKRYIQFGQDLVGPAFFVLCIF